MNSKFLSFFFFFSNFGEKRIYIIKEDPGFRHGLRLKEAVCVCSGELCLCIEGWGSFNMNLSLMKLGDCFF